MSSVSNINVKSTDYDVKDLIAREHITNKNNPHEVTAEQLGLASFENRKYSDLMTKAEINKTIAELNRLIGLLESRLDTVEDTTEKAVEAAEKAADRAANPKDGKMDLYINDVVLATHNFINGIKIDGHKIYYDVASDTINFE